MLNNIVCLFNMFCHILQAARILIYLNTPKRMRSYTTYIFYKFTIWTEDRI